MTLKVNDVPASVSRFAPTKFCTGELLNTTSTAGEGRRSRYHQPEGSLGVSHERGDVRVVHKPLREAAATCAGGFSLSRRLQWTFAGVLGRHDGGEVDGGAAAGVDFQPFRNITLPAE